VSLTNVPPVSLLPVAGSYFALSLFDRMWHPDLTEDEAIAMMEVCAVVWSSCMLSALLSMMHRRACSKDTTLGRDLKALM
jgi:hypothetical protein